MVKIMVLVTLSESMSSKVTWGNEKSPFSPNGKIETLVWDNRRSFFEQEKKTKKTSLVVLVVDDDTTELNRI